MGTHLSIVIRFNLAITVLSLNWINYNSHFQSPDSGGGTIDLTNFDVTDGNYTKRKNVFRLSSAHYPAACDNECELLLQTQSQQDMTDWMSCLRAVSRNEVETNNVRKIIKLRSWEISMNFSLGISGWTTKSGTAKSRSTGIRSSFRFELWRWKSFASSIKVAKEISLWLTIAKWTITSHEKQKSSTKSFCICIVIKLK